jgi:hypothetical protein
MDMNKSVKYVFFISLVISACTKEINMEIPENERKLVVNGVFNVGEPFKVAVSKSKGMLEKSNIENVDNAEVKLFENGVFITNLDTINQLWYIKYTYDMYGERIDSVFRNFYYSKNILLEQDKTYKIEITAPGIDRKAYVEIKAPTMVPIIKVDTLTISTDEWSKYLYFEVLISDPLTEKNYYIISLKTKNKYSWIDEFGVKHDEVATNFEDIETDDVVISNSNIEFESGIIFNDKLFNGRTQNIKFKKDYYSSEQSTDYMVILQSISKEYYDFLISSNLYISNDGNPIAEPVSVISNVNGGFGIVSAINQSIDSSIVMSGPGN